MNILVKHVRAEITRQTRVHASQSGGLRDIESEGNDLQFVQLNVGHGNQNYSPLLFKDSILIMWTQLIIIPAASELDYYCWSVCSTAICTASGWCFTRYLTEIDVPFADISPGNVSGKWSVLLAQYPQVSQTRMIEKCWDLSPDTRPHFAEICFQLWHLKCMLKIGMLILTNWSFILNPKP